MKPALREKESGNWEKEIQGIGRGSMRNIEERWSASKYASEFLFLINITFPRDTLISIWKEKEKFH